MEKLLGLRVDVDTHEGMRDGVPRLLDILGSAGCWVLVGVIVFLLWLMVNIR